MPSALSTSRVYHHCGPEAALQYRGAARNRDWVGPRGHLMGQEIPTVVYKQGHSHSACNRCSGVNYYLSMGQRVGGAAPGRGAGARWHQEIHADPLPMPQHSGGGRFEGIQQRPQGATSLQDGEPGTHGHRMAMIVPLSCATQCKLCEFRSWGVVVVYSPGVIVLWGYTVAGA
jgi:hypothetical protein